MNPDDAPIAIINGTIVDVSNDEPIERHILLIDRGRISAIVGSDASMPPGTRIVDAAGQFIIPGLLDANVHLVAEYWPVTLIRYEGRYDLLAIEAAQLTLRSGVTTVFDSWGPRHYLQKAQIAINAGQAIGSRLYFAGNIVGLGGPFTEDFFAGAKDALVDATFVDSINSLYEENVGPHLLWQTAEQVRAEIRTYCERGIDFLKFAVTGHGIDVESHILFSPRVQRAIVEEAHAAGLIAQTHTTSIEGLNIAIDVGVDMFQHVELTGPEPMPEEMIARLVETQIPGAFLANPESVLERYRSISAQDPGAGKALAKFLVGDRNQRALIKAGAKILMSTDGGVFSCGMRSSAHWKRYGPGEEGLLNLGEGHFNWLVAAEQKGMKPMDALRSATINIAKAYKVDHDLGSLAPGKIADLVILERNPLESAHNYRHIAHVMKDGRFVDRTQIPSKQYLSDGSFDTVRAGVLNG